MHYRFHSPHRRRQRAGATSGRNSLNQLNKLPASRFIHTATAPQQAAPYQPRHTFADFNLDPRLLANLKQRGFHQPTPIQDQAIGPVMSGQDLIGLANTGTGKTAAFLLPILHTYLRGNKQPTLIVVPTRELATQIYDEFRQFGRSLPIAATVCVGGSSLHKQIAALRRNPHIVIGTPGRLKDLLTQGKLHLGQTETLVLDEVDRMLDMGFIRDIRIILAQMPAKRQSLFLSATMTPEISTLAESLLTDPVTISVGTQQTSQQIDQDVIYVHSKDHKFSTLEGLLRQPEFSKVLVFGGTKYGVEKIAKKMNQAGFKVNAIHGNKTQPQRQRALDSFKSNQTQALIATDVAARGLDIPMVTHVINFDLPNTYDEYIHRIGRTGRAGQPGKALTFIETTPAAIVR